MTDEEKKIWDYEVWLARFNIEMFTGVKKDYAILAADDELIRLRAIEQRFTVPIVCICGSTRFKQAWISENARLTGEGYIVLAVGLWGHHERVFPDEATKKKLDELHLRKIDLCDWVWVLDIGGYIGESTRNEIAYAEALGKSVRYLSKETPSYVEPTDSLAAIEQRAGDIEGMAKLLMKLSFEDYDDWEDAYRNLPMEAQEYREIARAVSAWLLDPYAAQRAYEDEHDRIKMGRKK